MAATTKKFPPADDADAGVIARDEILYLDPRTIDPEPGQPRTYPDEELAESIRVSGVQEAISIRPHPDAPDRWMIINGERRWRGCMAAERWEIPARVRLDMEDLGDRRVNQLITNYGKPLTPIEEALAYQQIIAAKGWSQIELAKALGVPRSSVGDRLRLLELQPTWLELLKAGKLTVSQAVELARYRGVPDAYAAKVAAALTKYHGWSEAAGASDMDLSSFRQALISSYREIVYPLHDKDLNYDQPALSDAVIARHDEECSCGRIQFKRWESDKGGPCCGNPEWWKPEVEAAKRARMPQGLRQNMDAADHLRDLRASSATPASGRKWTDRGVELALPKGTPTHTKPGWQMPASIARLTDNDGRWTGEFDPAALTIDEGHLLRVRDEHEGGHFIATLDTAAVVAAEKQWKARWEARHEALRAPLLAAPSTVQGPGVRSLLRYGVDGEADELQEAVKAVAEARGIDIAPIAQWIDGDRWEPEPVHDWMDAQELTVLEQIATVWARNLAAPTGWNDPTSTKLRDEKLAATHAIRALPVPWVTKRPAFVSEEQEDLLTEETSAAALPDSANEEDLDEDDELAGEEEDDEDLDGEEEDDGELWDEALEEEAIDA